MADGFLGRWSQRKQAARLERDASKVPPPPVRQALDATDPEASRVPMPAPSGLAIAATPPPQAAAAAQASPTLEDVSKLGRDDDYAPFAAPDVAPEVRNAAMKKLFSDPHFQQIDGLDTYIDDYSVPSPLSAQMLQKMASAQFLKLVETPPDTEAAAPTPELAPLPETAPAAPISDQLVHSGTDSSTHTASS